MSEGILNFVNWRKVNATLHKLIIHHFYQKYLVLESLVYRL